MLINSFMCDLFLIPGAWSTSISFNYMISVFSRHPKVKKIHTFEYDTYSERVPDIINRAEKTINNLDKDIILVGHSLGGVIAVSISNHKNISGTMTISSPLAGLHLNKLVFFYLTHQIPILDDISSGSNIIKNIHQTKYDKPMTILVSTRGFNPVIFEPNDGIITVASQVGWKPQNARVKILETSHHEILQRSETMSELGRLLC